MNQAGYLFSGELVTPLLGRVGRLGFVEGMILVDAGKIIPIRVAFRLPEGLDLRMTARYVGGTSSEQAASRN